MLFEFVKDRNVIEKFQVSENSYVPRINESIRINDKLYIIVNITTEFTNTFMYDNIKKVNKITFKVK